MSFRNSSLRLKAIAAEHPAGKLPFELQSDGSQTRSFCHIDDLVRGVMVMRAKGEHLGIYHIGTTRRDHDRRSRLTCRGPCRP